MKYIKVNKINESTFGKDSWTHNNKFDYAIAVVDKLLDGEDLRTGNQGEGEVVKAELFDKEKLNALKERLKNKDYTCQETELTNCMIEKPKGSKNVWRTLFKGDFSGYNENSSKNKGNEYEKEVLAAFPTYEKLLMENNIPFFKTGDPSWTGPANNKRALRIDNNGNLTAAAREGSEGIGDIVADITVPTSSNTLYLSLKYGETVTFINAGVKKAFPLDVFQNTPEGRVPAFPPIGKAILDLFCIDPCMFVNIFNYYTDIPAKLQRNIPKTYEDVTDKIDIQKLNAFVESVVGFGYVIVHGFKNGVTHVYDLRTLEGMRNFLGMTNGELKPESVVIEYPGKTDDGFYVAKRIDIKVEYPGIQLKFNLRPKDGSVYPTHIMSDYKVKH